jgi:hypothetical protein
MRPLLGIVDLDMSLLYSIIEHLIPVSLPLHIQYKYVFPYVKYMLEKYNLGRSIFQIPQLSSNVKHINTQKQSLV